MFFSKNHIEFLLKFHFYIAFLLILFFIIGSIYVFYVKIKGTSFFLDKILFFFMAIIMSVQVIIGFLLMSSFLLKNNISVIEILKQKNKRYQLIEHPIMMIIGFFLFILSYIEFNKKGKITNKAAFLFILSLFAIFIRFPFHLLI
ncbi:hypothetical protein [Blattabacterium cuenoti]|uniref:hypothetical protein n=1 Tax=Blattabacterium cuenoti TaxID=1653831 RepID=UPI00163BDD75|nr:hypothetical protein [Blattabacterium cuenoti]